MDQGIFFLRSGKWRWRAVPVPGGRDMMELVDVDVADNRMSTTMPYSWRTCSEPELIELARRPEIRLWPDDDGILWRVAVVGPGTPYPYPLRDRHLVFDSEVTWAGITPLDTPFELGDLRSDELISYRDQIQDFGGRRRRYRKPEEIIEI